MGLLGDTLVRIDDSLLHRVGLVMGTAELVQVLKFNVFTHSIVILILARSYGAWRARSVL